MRHEFKKLRQLLLDAEKEADRINFSTECPDPAEGGCIGGPIPGLGCVNEASRYVARELRDLIAKIGSAVMSKARDARRTDAPTVAMNLRRPTDEIHRDITSRFPSYPYLWWELETDEQSGWVYKGDCKILCKLVQS